MESATVTGTLASSNVSHGEFQPGYSVRSAEQGKLRKFAQLQCTLFAPVTSEALDGPLPLRVKPPAKFSGRLPRETGGSRASQYFVQWLSIDVLRDIAPLSRAQ